MGRRRGDKVLMYLRGPTRHNHKNTCLPSFTYTATSLPSHVPVPSSCSCTELVPYEASGTAKTNQRLLFTCKLNARFPVAQELALWRDDLTQVSTEPGRDSARITIICQVMFVILGGTTRFVETGVLWGWCRDKGKVRPHHDSMGFSAGTACLAQ